MEDDKKGCMDANDEGAGRGDTSSGQAQPDRHVNRGKDSAREGSPAIEFSTLILGFASAAMISIGKVPDPNTGQVNKNLPVARQNIDIITMLQEKTRGNLNPEEENMLEHVLYELRVSYIEARKAEQ